MPLAAPIVVGFSRAVLLAMTHKLGTWLAKTMQGQTFSAGQVAMFGYLNQHTATFTMTI